MAKKTKIVPSSEIPEVAAFEEAKRRLQRMKEAYPEVFAQLEPLVEAYNDSLEAAGKVVSALGVDCGDFTKMSESITYDADKLYEHIGHKEFLSVGTIATKQVLTVDKKKTELAFASGRINVDIKPEVEKITPRYSKPKPVVLP